MLPDGVELSMETLGQMCRKWQQACRKTLMDNLMLGFSIPTDFKSTVGRLVDVPRNKTPGFSFMSDGRITGALQKIAKLLWGHLKNHPSFGAGGKASSSSNDGIVLLDGVPARKNAIRKWIIHCNLLQESLAMLFHTTSGSPCRATAV